MRIRQVKPSFWSDSVLSGLPEATRLFYIGTWCLADDAGWLDCNIPEIAHQLYGYGARTAREAKVTKMLATLIVLNDHLKTCVAAHPREVPPTPAEPRPVKVSKGQERDVDVVRNGQVRSGITAQAREDETTEFRAKVGWQG